MTASHIGNEHSAVLEHPQSSELASGSLARATVDHRGAAAVSHLHEAMRPDSVGMGSSPGTIQEMARAFDQPTLARTRKELESEVLQNYQRVEKNFHFHAGANRLLAYLRREHRSLAEVTTRDLEQWARTPIPSGKGNMPSDASFRGAKGFCAFAAQVGYIDAQRATDIAECTRPQLDLDFLRTILQNPLLTCEEREAQIRLNYQVAEKNANRQGGARDFLAYLHSQNKTLAEVTNSDLQRWALIPLTKGRDKASLPTGQAFDGAKGLCALAAEVGYIQAQRAKDFVVCAPPQLDLGSLRRVLQDPARTGKEREDHIRLYFQSVTKVDEHLTGARAFLAYLESQEKLLVEVTTSDLERWALTPVAARRGRVAVPSRRVFNGAKALCALAAEVGYIDVQRAKDLEEFKRPRFSVDNLRSILQNPALTPKEREYHIRLNYQSSESFRNRYDGAVGLLSHLESAEIPLSEVSTSDLKQWALTPMKVNGNLPDAVAFEGAKALCALAAAVGHIDGQRAQELATCKRPPFELDFLRNVLQNPGLSCKEREYQIGLNYQSWEKDSHRRGGAKGILAFLQNKAVPLSEVTTKDLQQWALTPLASGSGKGHLPGGPSFEGAKALCALAAEVGHIDAQRAQDIAQCARPQGDVGLLRMLIQNPELTPKERDYHIRLTYQSAEKNAHIQTGASRFLAYLESHDMSLADASKSNLQTWALTPFAMSNGRLTVPNSEAFEGAKALCALAAVVGHIAAQPARDLASCVRPHFEVDWLRRVLQNPLLTRKEREVQILLTYSSAEKSRHLLNGANGFLAYLNSQERSLAEVTENDLRRWAATPSAKVQGKRSLPSQQGFKGAKALCALAAEVGYIDAQRAVDLAECTRSQPWAPSTSTLTHSEAGLQVAESSRAVLERASKRLRTADQGASTSMCQSFAFPQSHSFFQDFTLSPPTLLDPNQYAPSAQAVSTQSLIDELESLEDILGSSGLLN